MKLTKEIIDKLIHEETQVYKYSFSVTSPIEYHYIEIFFNEDKSKYLQQFQHIKTKLYGTKHTLRLDNIHGVVMIDDKIFGLENRDDYESSYFIELSDYYLSLEEAREDYLASVLKQCVIELPKEHAFISLSPFFEQNSVEEITKVVNEMNAKGIEAKIIKTYQQK